ncbi:alpha/beta fold hydrolase, partial [Streptomyces sp. 12297]
MTISAGPRATALAAATAVLLSLAACSDDGADTGADTAATPKAPRLEWSSCPAPSAAEGTGSPPGPEWECSALDVPLDYDEPGGETIELALIRAKALDPKKRIGSLVYNFGGPGGSGVASLPGAAKDYQRLRARYDLVSFDPRGVGRSATVRCEDDQQLDAYYQGDSSPEGPAEEKEFVDGIKKYAAACERNSAEVLPHVGTLNAARDLDRLRAALGDEKLHYFGISYGTELGGVYAHLFPKNVGRAVFDAVVDPTKTSEEGSLGQAQGFQLALGNFAQDCVDRGE